MRNAGMTCSMKSFSLIPGTSVDFGIVSRSKADLLIRRSNLIHLKFPLNFQVHSSPILIVRKQILVSKLWISPSTIKSTAVWLRVIRPTSHSKFRIFIARSRQILINKIQTTSSRWVITGSISRTCSQKCFPAATWAGTILRNPNLVWWTTPENLELLLTPATSTILCNILLRCSFRRWQNKEPSLKMKTWKLNISSAPQIHQWQTTTRRTPSKPWCTQCKSTRSAELIARRLQTKKEIIRRSCSIMKQRRPTK